MRVKTAEIVIEEHLEQYILSNWQGSIGDHKEFELLDNRVLRTSLRIPIKIKGSVFRFSVASQLLFGQSNGKVALSIHCSLTKLILIPLITGAFIFTFFYFAQTDIIAGLLLSVPISSIFFFVLYRRLVQVSKAFLLKLTVT